MCMYNSLSFIVKNPIIYRNFIESISSIYIYSAELLRLVKSYIIDIWELRKSKLYGSGTGPLQHRSRSGRDTACQGKGKFGKLGGEKSCIVVYGSARSSEWEAMAQALRLPFEYYYYYYREYIGC